MNKPEIILVGGGGHCKSCIEVIEAEGVFDIKGIIDLPNLLGSKTSGYEVIGNDNDLPRFVKHGYSFLITMGHLGNPKRRNLLYQELKNMGADLPIVIAPSAFVSSRSTIKNGTIIMHQCVVNANSKIGENSIINNMALIEHDTVIGKDCHVSTGAIVNGDCNLGENSFIGSGAVVKNGIQICENSIIGSSTNVVKSITQPGIYFGNPGTIRA